MSTDEGEIRSNTSEVPSDAVEEKKRSAENAKKCEQ